MKRQNRDLNIFGMASLDLFASALGAFILVTVILFPYYPNTGDSKQKVAQVTATLQDVQSQLQQQQTRLQQTHKALSNCEDRSAGLRMATQTKRDSESKLQQCLGRLRKKFILVLMSWGSKDDVDLHVVDPKGREFYFKKKTFAGSQAKLEEDNIRGPGNEIWLHPLAGPGNYKIYYNYYRRRSQSVRVRGAVLTPDGKTALPDRRLQWEDQKPLVAVLTVDDNGDISIRTSP